MQAAWIHTLPPNYDFIISHYIIYCIPIKYQFITVMYEYISNVTIVICMSFIYIEFKIKCLYKGGVLLV